MLFGYEQAARVHIISEEEKMETTIAAISTAMSASGIGIVRISGENAMDVISRVYRSKGGKKKIKEVPTHTIHYGYIYDGADEQSGS